MKTETPLASLSVRVGLGEARSKLVASEYAVALVPVIDAVIAEPGHLWRAYDGVQLAKVVSAFNLDRMLKKVTGFDFAELVDRARIDLALQALSAGDATVDEVAESYWPPRTRAQLLKELNANIAVVDNKLSSRENLDGALKRTVDLNLDGVIDALRKGVKA